MRVAERVWFLWNVYRRLDEPTRRAWSRLGRGSVFVDVGANMGEISGEALARGATVHCIEPNPLAMKALKRAVPQGKRVFTYDFAASKSDGTEHLFCIRHTRMTRSDSAAVRHSSVRNQMFQAPGYLYPREICLRSCWNGSS